MGNESGNLLIYKIFSISVLIRREWPIHHMKPTIPGTKIYTLLQEAPTFDDFTIALLNEYSKLEKDINPQCEIISGDKKTTENSL